MRRDEHPVDRLQALAALERRHDLFSFRIDGWSGWRVMRNPIYRMAQGLPLAQPARSDSRRSLRALAATAKLIWLWLVAPQRELLIRTCRSALRVPQGERFRDVYFDGLIQNGHSCVKLEEINSADFDRQAAAAVRPPDLDTVVFTFWGRVLGLLFPVKALPFCTRLAALLEQEVAVSVSPRWLRMRISTVYWQSRLFAVLLARLRPKAVLVADTGEYALRIACRRRGIRFIELQHGVLDAADAVPAWVEGDAAELVMPDLLACRGTYWIEKLADTRQGREAALPVGNELIDFARRRIVPRPPEAPLHLVATSQGLDSERLAQWLADMIAAAPPELAWRLSLKLHPMYDAATLAYDRLRGDSRVRIIAGAEQPNLFDLLTEADLHLSISSASHFDAAALGVPTVVVPLSGHELVIGAVDNVQVFLAAEPAAVWKLARHAPIDAALTHRFATPGFVENLQRVLAP
ncbi:MAG: hypothetical protein K8R60_13035 [Burkholderiales bacterium]|nr:hypothetical protein [Burkholderiales bacterium]